MTRITFLIVRRNFYRLLSPIIDEALGQGWDVECWHDYSQPKHGLKGYEFPYIEETPRFARGECKTVSYFGTNELKALLGSKMPDVVVSLTTPFLTLGSLANTRWLTVHTLDFFLSNDPYGILSSNLSTIYSEHWSTFAIDFYRRKGILNSGDEQRLRANMVPVGFPELDQVSLIDPDIARLRLGVPKDRPVVVLLPYPGGSNPNTFWSRKIYSEPNRIRGQFSILTHRRWDYWPHLVRGWNDAKVVRAIRRFCDRNGAYLIVKSRGKDPIPDYTMRIADKYLYDESVYPATILQVLSIADLCIHFYSSAVTEAVYCGVPSLCIAPNSHDLLENNPNEKIISNTFFNCREEGLFQYDRVSQAMSIPEVIDNLPEISLEKFRMDKTSRSAYVKKFLGYEDGRSSERVLSVASGLVP